MEQKVGAFHRGMQRIAAEVAVEVGVRFQQSHRDALARQQQRQHRAGPPPTMQQVV
jgi:hypothetical protein